MSCNCGCKEKCSCDATELNVLEPTYETPSSGVNADLFPNGCSSDTFWEWGSDDNLTMPADGASAEIRVCSCKFSTGQTILVMDILYAELKITNTTENSDGSCTLTVQRTSWPGNPAAGLNVGKSLKVWVVKEHYDNGLCTQNVPPVELGRLLVVETDDPCGCDDEIKCVKLFNPQDPDAVGGEDDNPICGVIYLENGLAYVMKKENTAVDTDGNPVNYLHYLTGFLDGQCRPYTLQGSDGVTAYMKWDGDKFVVGDVDYSDVTNTPTPYSPADWSYGSVNTLASYFTNDHPDSGEHGTTLEQSTGASFLAAVNTMVTVTLENAVDGANPDNYGLTFIIADNSGMSLNDVEVGKISTVTSGTSVSGTFLVPEGKYWAMVLNGEPDGINNDPNTRAVTGTYVAITVG